MKKNFLQLRRILPLLLLLLCLTACTQPTPGGTETESQPPLETRSVRFLVDGQVYQQQSVPVGECPAVVEASIPGLSVHAWLDSTGTQVDPAAVPVTADTDYTALTYPELTNHVPYLFTDAVGDILPNEPLTADALVQALDALAPEAARSHFPKILTGNAPISRDYVRKILVSFFPQEAVDEALPASSVSQLLRWEFAVSMNRLLGRTGQETVSMAKDAQIPMDLFCEQSGSFDLLEAAIPHIPSVEGTPFSSIELPTEREPGLVNIDGWLYFVQENGQFLRDGNVGELYFGQNGRFTSTDPELDGIVADVLNQIITDNPEMDRLELLRQCQIYCRDTFKYLRQDPYLMGQTGWELEDAKEMFQTGRGNCYGFAAAFWALARGLGYEAYAISGTCLEDRQPHSWVMIEFDGEEFFFDPEWEWAYHDREVYDKDMFMLSLSEAEWWGYDWYPHW